MILERSVSKRSMFATELAEGVTVGKLIVMFAALVSLYVDQSFGGAFTTVQTYAGGTLGSSADELPWTSIGYNTFYYSSCASDDGRSSAPVIWRLGCFRFISRRRRRCTVS
jgi:hypothetical protein